MKWFVLAGLLVLVAGGVAAASFFLFRGSGPSDPGRIAFWQAGQLDAPNLFVMTPDDESRPRPQLKGFYPTWSPDGKRIAYSREDEDEVPDPIGTSGIWVFSPDALEIPRRLLTPPTLYADFPAWSPDGTMIAFSGFAQTGDVFDPNFDIYVMPASDGDARALTQTPTVDEEQPSWSPDGTKIVYERSGSDPTDSPDIWVMNSDGSDQRALVATADYDHAPAWSPDGEEIAFMRQYPPAGGRSLNNMEIVVVKVDGTGFRLLTRSRYYDSDPAWSPDGERIVFVSDRTGSDELFVINAEGGGLKQLTEHEPSRGPLGFDSGEYAGPAWGRTPSG
jgi:TolB protein